MKNDELGRKIPETNEEKIAILRDAAALLRHKENWIQGDWKYVVNDTERFCLTGGIQRAMGYQEPGTRGDEVISKCSLTSSMYDCISDTAKKQEDVKEHMAAVNRKIEQLEFAKRQGMKEEIILMKENVVLQYKLETLQRVNDNTSHRTVLNLLERTIERLEDQS